MDYALSVTTTTPPPQMQKQKQIQMQVALLKPLILNRARQGPLLPSSGRLNLTSTSIVLPLRCSAASSGGHAPHLSSPLPPDTITLHVGGMMCEGCAANVKKLLETRPQVSSASVNLTAETAIVWPVSEEKTAPNWQKQLGEALAQHLTSCGFNSTLRGQEDSD